MSGVYVLYPGYVDQPGLQNAIGSILRRPDGWYVADLPGAQAIVAGYTLAMALAWLKTNTDGTGKLDVHNANLANFNLNSFIAGGTLTPFTKDQFSTFCASWGSNWRAITAAINAAPDKATLAAISLTAGYPINS